MESIFFEIALVVIVAAVLSIIFRYFKQPTILAYILTGIILGPLGFFHLKNPDSLQTLGEMGITLLLFMLGLELKLHELRSIGKTAVIAGTLQMVITGSLGYVLAGFLGYSATVGFIVAIALCFSSTIVIVKLLSDKKDLTSLHGKLAIGILLMQDFFAILILIFINGFHLGSLNELISQIVIIALKLSVLIGWILLFSRYVFPRILHNLSKSGEILFLFSLAWVFAVTALVTWQPIGFSIEIGGFLAGLALANTHENYQIIARMKSLRDFFMTIFFVMLGLDMTFTNFSSSIIPAICLSLFVILLKPFIVMLITGVLGFRKRTSFFVGTSLGQVSEFSLIILFLAQSKGLIPESVVTIIVLVSVITFTTSTYIIQNTNKLYKVVGSWFSLIELRKNGNEHEGTSTEDFTIFNKHVVLIGGHQMGKSVLHALKQSKEQVLVVDFDPDIIKKLKNEKTPALFGDISDPDIQERVGFDRAKMVISTVPDLEDNLLLIQGLTHTNKRAKIVVIAFESDDAKLLYKAGADYVVLPHLAGGHHLAKILLNDDELEMIEKYKKKDLEYLI
jgi:Kef-type K+ transport system membrane component KefB